MTDLNLSQGWVDALRAAHDHDVPPSLRARLRRQLPAPLPRSIYIAVGVLGWVIFQHGMGNIVFPRWIADQTHGHYDAHSYREGAIAMVGVGLFMVFCAVRKRWLRPASAVGVPVGIGFGLHGAPEVTTTLAGFALHAAEGVTALALLFLWWRYARRRPSEEEA